MGSSAKKKNDKKKDFKKPKLKIGKVRPKPTNFTDTSFKSKSIVLVAQSLTLNTPTLSSQFYSHISLLTNRSDTQRRESLAYLTTAISSRPVNTPLPQPLSVLLPKLYPLILDGSNGVRSQLLKLLRTLPPKDVGDYISQLLLYIRAGLTHMAVGIKLSAADVLLWALETMPYELVTCVGGWVKTLDCLLTGLLHWHVSVPSSAWTSARAPTLGTAGAESKLPVKVLNVMAVFLHAGLVESPTEEEDINARKWPFPLRYTETHMLPKRSNAFAHLNLFGPPRDAESEMYVERQERQRVFYKKFQERVAMGIEEARREGGEVGRAAARLGKVLAEGMEGFEPDI